MNAVTPIEREHSPKGASSAERWMNCAGSAALLKQLEFPETDEPEYRGLGKAAHKLASHCLETHTDTWEYIGGQANDHKIILPSLPEPELKLQPGFYPVDKDMTDAVQTYLDYARTYMTGANTVMVEERIGRDPLTRPHPDFYGTVDFGAYGAHVLAIIDYKHGEGIYVEAENNLQMKYYAYGVLYERRQRGVTIAPDRLVKLVIVQPRCYAEEGGIREWETTAGEILAWGDDFLIPKMEATEIDNDFNAGQWCRFCPAKLFCPLLVGLFGAAAKANPKAIPQLSDVRLSLEYQQREAVKFYMKALDDEVLRRNMTGNTVPETKLVYKKSNRVFRDGAVELFTARFGDEAFEKPSFKSPAGMEKISDEAKKLVKEWAFMPKTGLTVVPLTDNRTAVKVEKVVDTFAHLATQSNTEITQ